jgi:hypothetical protein
VFFLPIALHNGRTEGVLPPSQNSCNSRIGHQNQGACEITKIPLQISATMSLPAGLGSFFLCVLKCWRPEPSSYSTNQCTWPPPHWNCYCHNRLLLIFLTMHVSVGPTSSWSCIFFGKNSNPRVASISGRREYFLRDCTLILLPRVSWNGGSQDCTFNLGSQIFLAWLLPFQVNHHAYAFGTV